jgi:glycosyltransferase involved in cell wall biosynthesis
VSIQQPAFRIAWEQLGFPLQLRRAGADLVHGTVNVIPETLRGPAVVTVHDLSFLRHPERLSGRRRLYLQWSVKRSVGRAEHIIAVSGSTRDDLVELWDVPAEKVTVIPLGVDPSFKPLPMDEGSRKPLGGRPYILHVGTLEPRKNIEVLVRAFASLRERIPIPHALALVGARGWAYQPIFDLVTALGLHEHVQFVDYVGPEHLPLWYTRADLFAFPSVYEGFGLPVLEAMACGLPVVTTDSSSLRELAADAALLVEPGSSEALEDAMGRILEDRGLRDRLRAKGLERAARYSWETTARETALVYEAVIGTA